MTDVFLTDLVELRPSIDLQLILDLWPSRRQVDNGNGKTAQVTGYLISLALRLSACTMGLSL